MESTKGYKYRIYPNKTQQNLINRTLGCVRFVYNHFLAVRRDEWKANKESINYTKSSQLLTDLKRREETAWLNEVDSMALQESLRNLDRAYTNFFEKRSKYPRFKSKHRHSQSYRTRNQSGGIRMAGNRIKLPKIGLVKIKQSRFFDGKIHSATVSRTASGKYFVSLCVSEETELLPNAGGKVGLDVGLKCFCTDSNGHTVENPRVLRCRFSLKERWMRDEEKKPRFDGNNAHFIRDVRDDSHIYPAKMRFDDYSIYKNTGGNMKYFKTRCQYGYELLLSEKPPRLDNTVEYIIIGESIYYPGCVIIQRRDSCSFNGKKRWIVPRHSLY